MCQLFGSNDKKEWIVVVRMLVYCVLTFVNKCGDVVKVVLCCKKLVEMTKNQKNLLCRGVEKPASTQENDAF